MDRMSTPLSFPESGRRVLVVDDDPDTQFILPAALTFAGYPTRVAANGIAALDFIDEELPDVIILDLAMPLLNGSDVLAMLKAREETRDIPIIACTAAVSSWDVPRLLKDGFGEVLLKPVDPRAVLSAVERLLAARGSRPSTADPLANQSLGAREPPPAQENEL